MNKDIILPIKYEKVPTTEKVQTLDKHNEIIYLVPYSAITTIDLLNTILIALASILMVYEIFLGIGNYETFFLILTEHPHALGVTLFIFFILITLLKAYSITIACLIYAKIKTTFAFKEMKELALFGLIAGGASIIGMISFLVWSFSSLAITTNLAILFNYLLYLGVVGISFAISCISKTEEEEINQFKN